MPALTCCDIKLGHSNVGRLGSAVEYVGGNFAYGVVVVVIHTGKSVERLSKDNQRNPEILQGALVLRCQNCSNQNNAVNTIFFGKNTQVINLFVFVVIGICQKHLILGFVEHRGEAGDHTGYRCRVNFRNDDPNEIRLSGTEDLCLSGGDVAGFFYDTCNGTALLVRDISVVEVARYGSARNSC